MKLLVDTNVWVDFFSRGDARLAQWLAADAVVMHEAVLGELACGNLAGRAATLAALWTMPRCTASPAAACLACIEQYRLYGLGVGWVDVQLLAAARTERLALWTRDRRLQAACETVGIPRQPASN